MSMFRLILTKRLFLTTSMFIHNLATSVRKYKVSSMLSVRKKKVVLMSIIVKELRHTSLAHQSNPLCKKNHSMEVAFHNKNDSKLTQKTTVQC